MFIQIGILSPSDPRSLPRKAFVRVSKIVVVTLATVKASREATALTRDITAMTIEGVGEIFVNETVDRIKELIDTAGKIPDGFGQ